MIRCWSELIALRALGRTIESRMDSAISRTARRVLLRDLALLD
jgi:hypothetical protein